MTAPYRCSEKISVTFTEMPSASTAVIAGMPSSVAGILMYMLGRSTSHHSCLASAMVGVASRASRGSTSSDTRPSTPPDWSYTGRSTSAAQRMSALVIIRAASSTVTLRAARSLICSS